MIDLLIYGNIFTLVSHLSTNNGAVTLTHLASKA